VDGGGPWNSPEYVVPPSLPDIDTVVATLGLEPHPEGGFYARTYAAEWEVPQATLPAGFAGPRPVQTMIYYLLPRGGRSRLHRIRSDETWHIYLGGPIQLIDWDPSRPDAVHAVATIPLGPDLLAGERPQHVVRAGHWFGAMMPDDAAAPYTLCGCTVAPGFDFAEFELADPAGPIAWPPAVQPLLR